jgi:hypothetical protein
VIALGPLGWSLRRIEAATGVRREAADGYLRSAGIALRTPGSWDHNSLAKAATSVTTGPYWRKRDRTRILSAWPACEINGETIAHELERRRNATGSLVQNFRAGFVPLELPNRMSWYSATTTRVSGRLRVGKPEPLATGVGRHRARIVNPDVACELGHEGFSYCVSSLSTRCRTDCLFTLSPSYFFELPQPR